MFKRHDEMWLACALIRRRAYRDRSHLAGALCAIFRTRMSRCNVVVGAGNECTYSSYGITCIAKEKRKRGRRAGSPLADWSRVPHGTKSAQSRRTGTPRTCYHLIYKRYNFSISLKSRNYPHRFVTRKFRFLHSYLNHPAIYLRSHL